MELTITTNDLSQDKKRIKRSQDIVPVSRCYETGMFRHAGNRYSMTYDLKDIDYLSASDDEREKVFDSWSELLNSLDSAKASMKITICNRKMNKKDKLRQTLLRTDYGDGYDHIRIAYNRLRYEDIQGEQGYIQDKYITFSTVRKNKDKAESYFRRMERDLNKKFINFDSGIKSQGISRRGEILHGFLQAGRESEYNFEWNSQKGVATNTRKFIDSISPDIIRPHSSYFEINDMVGRCMLLRAWGSSIKDDFFTRLGEIRTNMVASCDVIAVSNSEARKIIERKDDSVETSANLWSGKRNVREGAAERLPRQISKDRKVVDSYNQAMDYDNQKMFLVQVLVCFLAENMDKLDDYTDSIRDTAGDYNCEMSNLCFQQMKGLQDVLPFGERKIQYLRDCDTDTTAILLPFNSVQLSQNTGIPYGKHEETKQQQWVDRRRQGSGHEWILGKTGFGKSVDAKLKILYEILLTDGDGIILDPDGEYAPLVYALGGQIIRVGVDNINVADISAEYGYVDEVRNDDPIAKKSNLILSFMESILDDGTKFGETEKSLVDRAVRTLASDVLSGVYAEMTLKDIYDLLKQYQEPAAGQLALALERHIEGSFNTFAKPTNVQIQSRLVCYDLSTLNKQEKDAGMIVVMDQIDQRLITNRKYGRATYITFDEMDYFFKHSAATLIIEDFFERCRKYGGFLRAIVQNVTKILQNPAAATMIKNSENVIMFKQDHLDAVQLADMYSLSSIQVKMLETAEVGHGIAKIGNVIYSFDGTIPQDSEIYQLVNTTVVKIT
ncbi:MAG: VirB4-like conjugal transfer ATPase, CD1110 family [Wujia sp.]